MTVPMVHVMRPLKGRNLLGTDIYRAGQRGEIFLQEPEAQIRTRRIVPQIAELARIGVEVE